LSKNVVRIKRLEAKSSLTPVQPIRTIAALFSATFISMTTYTPSAKTIKRDWFVVDATDKVLGRLASEIANRLRGKHKPEYTPNLDTGDYIIVVNAEKVRVTGNKRTDKIYYRHSGYPGGLKQVSFDKLMSKAPTDAITKAVKGMLPRGPLGRAMFRKLKVYAGPEHGHAPQQPQVLEI
jgi:large subunit ribosomal protein L13